MVDLGTITKNGKCLLLAYDQGMEHGPTDFNDANVDPEYICKIAREAQVFTGIVFGAGIAEKYYPNTQSSMLKAQLPPLILKLNGKTGFHKGEEPVSLQLTSVERAIELGAKAVGYTVYVGSEREEEMMKELAQIVGQAHAKNLPVIAWMYPRGKHVEAKETSRDTVAYAARLALELGADVAKLPYTGDAESFSWVVKSAGKTGVLAQGGAKKEEGEFLKEASEIMQSGAMGMAVGRNIWQNDNPVELSKKLAEVIFNTSG
ncbi:MAG: Fructose-bisphosphate aldolase [Candidatus Amesbacteria bacterium GW2011_GWA2_42_12]|uniref:Fructose-bisphosphate aldolase n=1 Tax=Candidatus Amesbacteria bacterium GW2011_GWA2_42_12 TaxID=1618356 RepID=A0A0G1B599_9BACT|nr:MAG: Fructose-bisphosphate aldolase [Candidatus Amesbacteria bacterium GW2011_GWA2_42_12]